MNSDVCHLKLANQPQQITSGFVLMPVFSVFRKRVRFDRAAEFLAACASGDIEEAQVMLKEAKETKKKNGEDVAEVINCSNADGITALHQVRQFHLLCWLMNKKHLQLNYSVICFCCRFVCGTQACIDGSMEMVTFLLERDASVNQVDNEGWTPLHVAASCGHADIAEWVAYFSTHSIMQRRNSCEIQYSLPLWGHQSAAWVPEYFYIQQY